MNHENNLTGYTATCGEPNNMLDLGTAGSYGLEKLHVTADAAWNGLTITATFTNSGSTTVPVTDGAVDVPPEATRLPTRDRVRYGMLAFKGVDANGKLRIISTPIYYKVQASAATDGSNTIDPTPDQYAQFVAEVMAEADRAEAAADRAESAGGNVTPEQIAEAVNSYLDENPVQPTAIDATLTQSGQAADAAAVGDALGLLSEEKVTMPVDAGGIVQNGISGQILQSNGDGTTQWVEKPTGGSSSGITDINIKKWVGKKIVIDGSSITAGGTGNTVPVWGSFLKDMFALAECYNHAVSGTGWFFSGDSYVVDRVDVYENDADAVILMGDYNGIYAYTSNPGTIDDAPAADGSYYAKLKYLAEKLITKYPMCPVIWVVEPPRGAQGDGKTPMDYASIYALQSKCIEEVADYYGFPHCNLMKSTIFRPWNETNYAATTSDGTHPWNNIQRTMAQVIAETMKRTPLIYNESYVNTPGDSSGGTTEDDSNKTLTKITATFTQGDAVIKTTDELDILRNYLLVVATYSDLSEATVTDYTLSGELTEGTSTITVAYGTATTTFNVNVTLDGGSVTVALGDVIDESTIGYYFNKYFDLTAREGMRISQYLPVLEGTDITLSGNLTYPNITTADIVYYDADKTRIGSADHVYGTVTFTVPDGTSYFRISFDDDDDTKTITYFHG